MKRSTPKLLYHSLILFSIGFTIYIYLGEFSFLSWVPNGDGSRYFHLVLTIPFFLLAAFLMRRFVVQDDRSSLTRILRFFPIACLILISGYFFIISLSYEETILGIGLVIAVILLVVECILLEEDFKQ